MGYQTENVVPGDIGKTLRSLAETIRSRRDASMEESYTAKLLKQSEEYLLKKVGEESIETILAATSGNHDHLRYEIADLIYHVMVLMEKYGVSLDELAGELDARVK